MHATYDPDARALYLRFSDRPVDRSVEHGDDFVVDFDASSEIVGIEVLWAPMSWPQLIELASQYGFETQIDEAWASMQAVQPALQARSGSSHVFTVCYFGTGPLVTGASSASLGIDPHEFELAG